MITKKVKEDLFSGLEIVEVPSISKDRLLIIAPLTDDEQKQCYSSKDIIRMLFKKKKVAIMESIK